MENLETHNSATRQWIERVSEWAPTIGQAHPVFGRFADLGGLILTGSTTLGVVDEYSDLDLELVLSEDAVAQVDTASPTRYIECHLDGKPGSVIVVSADAWNNSVGACDMPLIAELRCAVMIAGVHRKRVAADRYSPPDHESRCPVSVLLIQLLRDAFLPSRGGQPDEPKRRSGRLSQHRAVPPPRTTGLPVNGERAVPLRQVAVEVGPKNSDGPKVGAPRCPPHGSSRR